MFLQISLSTKLTLDYTVFKQILNALLIQNRFGAITLYLKLFLSQQIVSKRTSLVNYAHEFPGGGTLDPLVDICQYRANPKENTSYS